MKRDIIDRIEQLKLTTDTNIQDIQFNCSPHLMDATLTFQFSYNFEGYEYYIYDDDVQLYLCNDIPFMYTNDSNETYIDSLINLVDKQKVFPFILFVNGYAIPWSKITIVKDYTSSYIIIRDIPFDTSDFARILYIPTYQVRYGEDDDISVDIPEGSAGIYFDSDGKLTFDELQIAMRVEILDLNIVVGFQSITADHAYVELPVKNGQYAISSQFVPFKFKLCTASMEYTPSEKYVGFCGIYGFDALTATDVDVMYFYYIPGAENSNGMYMRNLDFDGKIKPQIREYWNGTESDFLTRYRKLFDRFDFTYDKTLSYETNVTNALRYIAKNDIALFNKVLVDRSTVKSECYKGSEFKALVDEYGYVRYSRKRSAGIDDYVIIFVNGCIYKNYIDVTYTTNTIDIPVIDIMDDDDIEILFFMNVNNKILDINVENGVSSVYISPYYNLKECMIYDTVSDDPVYETKEDPNGRSQFIADYSYTETDNNYTIKFSDIVHYGRDLKLVPNRQFRYYRYSYQDQNYKLILPLSFNYCNNIDQYLVFINGKKISRNEFTITISNPYRPFDQKWIYFSTFLLVDDVIEIFYVPDEMKSFDFGDTEIKLKENGSLISVNTYPFAYSISKDTCFFFVNGKKANPNWINDISMNMVQIDTKINAMDNVEIIEYQTGEEEITNALIYDYVDMMMGGVVEGTEELRQLRVSALEGDTDALHKIGTEVAVRSTKSSDEWTTKITEMILNEDTDYILKEFDQIIENPEANYKNDYVELKAVLYQIVLDFYINKYKVRTGSKFIYDFEMDAFNLDNTGDSNIIPLTNSSLEDKMFNYIFADDYIPSTEIPNDMSVQQNEVWIKIPYTALGHALSIPYTTSDGRDLEATVFESRLQTPTSETAKEMQRILGHKYTLTDGILDLRNISDYNTTEDMIIRIRPIPEFNDITNIVSFTIPEYSLEYKSRTKYLEKLDTTLAAPTLKIFSLLESNITDANSLLANCVELTNAYFTPSEDKVQVTSSMFKNCGKLIEVNKFDTSLVKDFSYMFMNCSSITSIHNYTTVDAESFSHMLEGCSTLTTIPQFNMTHAKDTSYMLRNCTNLIRIPRIVTTEVTNMSYMFEGCRLLQEIPELNTLKATDLTNTFEGCSALEYLNLFQLQADLDLTSSLRLNSDSVHTILSTARTPVGPTKTIEFDYDIQYITITDYKHCHDLGWTVIPSPLIITPSETIPPEAEMKPNHIYCIFPKTSVVTLGKKPTGVRVYANITFDTYDEDKTIDLTTVTTPYDKVLVDINLRDMEDITGVFADTFIIECANIEMTDNKNLTGLFENCSDLYKVKLHLNSAENLTAMFRNCDAISFDNLIILDSGNAKILNYMFADSAIEDIPLFDTSGATSMNSMFYKSSVLTVPAFNTSNVTDMSYAFYESQIASAMGITDWDVSNVVNMSHMFYNCRHDFDVMNVVQWEMPKVTDMSYMFSKCAIETANIADASICETMEGIFADCPNLISVTFGKITNLVNIDSAFVNCTKLTTVTGLSLINIKTITTRTRAIASVNNTFDGCTALTTLEILNLYVDLDLSDCVALSKDSVNDIISKLPDVKPNTKSITFNDAIRPLIENAIFWNAYDNGWNVTPKIALTVNAIPPDKSIKVNEVWYAINGTNRLITPKFTSTISTDVDTLNIEVYDESLEPFYTGKIVNGFSYTYTGTNPSGILLVKLYGAQVNTFELQDNTERIKLNTPSLTSLKIGIKSYETLVGFSLINSALLTGEKLFYGCSALEDISILNFRELRNTKLMFAKCSSLRSIPFIDTSVSIDMSAMFSFCSSLEEIPELYTIACSDMSYMFYNCESLTSVSGLNVVNVSGMDFMFQGCRSLTNVSFTTIPRLKNSTKMMFDGCNVLTSVPELDTTGVTDMTYMFRNCRALETIPLYNTSNVTTMEGMMSSCTRLTNVPLLNTSNVINMDRMFAYCSSLITVPLFDTSSVIHMTNMFLMCSKLINVPALNTFNVKYMNGMFRLCSSLRVIPVINAYNVIDDQEFYGCDALELINITNIKTNVNIADTSVTSSALRTIITNMENTQAGTTIIVSATLYSNITTDVMETAQAKDIVIAKV